MEKRHLVVKEYYEERYKDPERSKRQLEDYKIYLRYVGITGESTGRLLDIACGDGLLLKNAEATSVETFGTDLSSTAIRLSKKLAAKSKYALNPGETICFLDGTFDYVFCLGSLEHFLDIPKGLREMKRIGKHDATYCILVPNTIHYRLDANSKWGIKKITGTKQQEMQESLHSYKEWQEILRTAGFKIMKCHRDLFYEKKKSALKNLLFYIWLRLLPFKFAYQFIFICRK
jgi:ubiquinone/menaquinone biosynthesis C-methylase UbiE